MSMRVWTLWFGGASYSPPEVPHDVESFDSLRAALDDFWRRADHDPYYPCVGEDSELWIFLYDPTGDDVRDPDPDRRAYFGPRGGVRVEPC